MKTASILLTASMAGAVAAQKLSDYFPECSLSCLEKGTTSATDCSLGDAACFCEQSNYEAIYTTELSCVLKECGSGVSVDKVLPAAVQFCSAAIASASASATATATGKADSTSATTAATTKTTSHAASSEATETAASQTTSSSQSSAAPETTAANSTLVASGRPVTTTSATTSFSTAAAAAAGPMVTAAMLVAGVVALL